MTLVKKRSSLDLTSCIAHATWRRDALMIMRRIFCMHANLRGLFWGDRDIQMFKSVKMMFGAAKRSWWWLACRLQWIDLLGFSECSSDHKCDACQMSYKCRGCQTGAWQHKTCTIQRIKDKMQNFHFARDKEDKTGVGVTGNLSKTQCGFRWSCLCLGKTCAHQTLLFDSTLQFWCRRPKQLGKDPFLPH